MNVKEAVKILKQDKDIVIAGPDYTDSNKLRVYVNGGLIGKIYAGDKQNGTHELISTGYFKYYQEETGEKSLEKIVSEAKEPLSVMVSKDYIRACKNAVESRFGKKKGDFSKNGEKERHLQTRIVRYFMENGSDFAVTDMEIQCPKKWFTGNSFGKTTTDQPRFDMIVLSNDGVGVIELKVNNDNTDNMLSHYEHMEFLLTNKETKTNFLNEIRRRTQMMINCGLLDEKVIEYLKKNDLWCGFLFVGGKLTDSQKLITPFKEKRCVNQLKFLYYPKYEIEDIDFKKTLSFDEFMNLK